MNSRRLAKLYLAAHDAMRNIDGLQPQESFDELLKFLFYSESANLAPRAEFSIDRPQPSDPGPAPDANEIRARFKLLLEQAPDDIRRVWPSASFDLSDQCLHAVARLFAGIDLRHCGLDVRSAALKESLPPEIRKGLGIYLTPDEVVGAAVQIVSPPRGARVLDPACGSGTFLLEVIRSWNVDAATDPARHRIWAIDKNPRMLVLADLNLGHVDNLEFRGSVRDSLFGLAADDKEYAYGSFDYIFTNPPFGVYLDAAACDLGGFETCKASNGTPLSRQQSEVVFLEQCFRFLKPGARLVIVLPKSVISNAGEKMVHARQFLGTQGYVEGVLALPPETFYAAGTQANTVVLFMRKYSVGEDRLADGRIWLSEVTNCGYDSTGRARAGGQLGDVPGEIRNLLASDVAAGTCRWLATTKRCESLARLPALLSHDEAGDEGGVPLRELTTLIVTGRTPPRSTYTDEGLYLVKVGNLTGKGLAWTRRDRNFVSTAAIPNRAKAGLMLGPGDIVLTSSAHSPVYIGKKVDIITNIPSWVAERASLVGEVMLVRPDPAKIDPFALLAFLRAPETTAQIRRLVRGQTAHLNPSDVGSVTVPRKYLAAGPELTAVTSLLREESDLAEASARISWKLATILNEFRDVPGRMPV
jgi:type I restriction enzyme M protein